MRSPQSLVYLFCQETESDLLEYLTVNHVSAPLERWNHLAGQETDQDHLGGSQDISQEPSQEPSPDVSQDPRQDPLSSSHCSAKTVHNH